MVIFAFWSLLGHSSTASRQVPSGIPRARVMGCEPEVVGQGNRKVNAKESYALPRATPPFRVARRVTLHRLVNFQVPIKFFNTILAKNRFLGRSSTGSRQVWSEIPRARVMGPWAGQVGWGRKI